MDSPDTTHKIVSIVTTIVCSLVVGHCVTSLLLSLYAGWCYIAQANKSDHNYLNYIIAEYVSYEIWVFLVYIILPGFYFSAFIYIKYKVSMYNYNDL